MCSRFTDFEMPAAKLYIMMNKQSKHAHAHMHGMCAAVRMCVFWFMNREDREEDSRSQQLIHKAGLPLADQ